MKLTGDELVVKLPGIFGSTRWAVPLGQLAAADLRAPRARRELDDPDGLAPAADWDFAEPLRIPYACTTSPLREPNLVLLFASPQRTPRLRVLGGTMIDLSRPESRSAQGSHIDGLEVRAKNPDAALRSFRQAGVLVTDSAQAWLSQGRQASPAPRRPAPAPSRRWPFAAATAALGALAITSFVTRGSVATGPVVVAALAIMGGLRRRRSQRWASSPAAASQRAQ